jgi:DNA-binding MarR family transcriptional regulator
MHVISLEDVLCSVKHIPRTSDVKQTSARRKIAIATPEEQTAALAERNRCNNQALRKAMRIVSAFYDEVLAPTGLRGTQRSILMNIAREGTATINRLAEKLGLDRTALSRNLRPLMREGLIAVATDKKDKRIRCVTLTGKGDERLRQTLYLWQVAQEKFEEAFGREEARALRETLAKVAALDLRNSV